MKEEAEWRRGAGISNIKEPPEDSLCHLVGLWISDQEEDQSAVEGILRLYRRAHLYEWGI